MNTIEEAPKAGRRRRAHSAEFKARVVAECRHPGVSIASVALANGINANLLRRWVEAEASGRMVRAAQPAFVALPMPNAATLPPQADIRIEVRRGATAVNIAWPVQAAGDCAAWLRELLR